VTGGHYREMAGKLRELARLAQSPFMRKERSRAALRSRGDYFDRRTG